MVENSATWNLYEVVFWNSNSSDPNLDTIFLTRARGFEEAINLVKSHYSPANHTDFHYLPLSEESMSRTLHLSPHCVYELGTVKSMSPKLYPVILRGPYFATAYNYGFKSWIRDHDVEQNRYYWREDE